MIEDDEQETIQSLKQPNFLTPKPNEIKDAEVLLPSKLSKDYVAKERTNFNNFEFEESLLPEFKPLAFTVGENFFNLEEGRELDSEKSRAERKWIYKKSPNLYIQKRGLLQFKNKSKRWRYFSNKDLEGYKETIPKHIELQFPTKKGFAVKAWDREEYDESDELAKTKIYFHEIESVSFNSGWFKAKANIIIKLKPEMNIHRLAIDKVDREIVITVVRKDFKLAERIAATILTQINEIELRKIFR